MSRRWLAFLAFVGVLCWHWGWEFIRGLFYEQGSHMLRPLLANVSWDDLLHYGPSAGLLALGGYLFWTLRPPKVTGPFAAIQIRMQPRGAFDPFEVIAKIDGLRRQDGVTILVKYAEAIHGLNEVYWEWSQSYRLVEQGNILPNEALRPTVLLRLNDGDDEISDANYKTYKVGDGLMLLVEVRAIAGEHTIVARQPFFFRNIKGARLSEPARLDELSYIDKLDG